LITDLFLEYRKEYIEFFLLFFKSPPGEINDETRLKFIEEYEKLKDSVNI
jgi:hypothetical protein